VDMLVAYHCSILPKSMEAQECSNAPAGTSTMRNGGGHMLLQQYALPQFELRQLIISLSSILNIPQSTGTFG